MTDREPGDGSGTTAAPALPTEAGPDLPPVLEPGPAEPLDADRSTWRRVLGLAWPVLAQQLLLLSVGLSDQYLAGHFRPAPGSSRIAFQSALTNANYAAWFISSYTVLVSVGSTALVARFVGAGDWATARRVTHQALLLAVVLGGVASVAGLLGLDGLIALLNLEGESARHAATFLRPLLLLLVFQVVESAGIACLAGAGDTRTGLWVLGGMATLNVPLAWGFCWGVGPLPGLGFVGIALGTGLAHTLGGLAVLVLLARGRAGLRLRLGLFRPDFDLIRRLLRVSVPAAVDSLSLVAGQFWFLSLVNRLGDVAIAAHGIAIRWEALGFLSGAAFGTAAMTLVGQNLGAGRPREAARSGWVAFALGGAVMSAMGLIFFTLARPMFRLFNPDPSQLPVIEAGVPVLRLVAFAMPALAGCIVFTGALRGAGDTRVPVLFTWTGFLGVRIPLAYLLTRDTLDLGALGVWPAAGLGLYGAWLAMFADLTVRGAFFLGRFAGGRWKETTV